MEKFIETGYKQWCCTTPIGYRTICGIDLSKSASLLCKKCLHQKWGQEPTCIETLQQLPITRDLWQIVFEFANIPKWDSFEAFEQFRVFLNVATDTQNRDILCLLRQRFNYTLSNVQIAAYLLDCYGNTQQTYNMLLLHKHVKDGDHSLVSIAKYLASETYFGRDYFAFLNCALRQKTQSLLYMLLMCDDFVVYCCTQLNDSKSYIKTYLLRKCVFWRSFDCLKRMIISGVFEDTHIAMNTLEAIARASNMSKQERDKQMGRIRSILNMFELAETEQNMTTKI